jgi:hypothetical protein
VSVAGCLQVDVEIGLAQMFSTMHVYVSYRAIVWGRNEEVVWACSVRWAVLAEC